MWCWRLTNKQWYEPKSASSTSVLRAIRQWWQVTTFILKCLWPCSLKAVAVFTSSCYIWRFSSPQLCTSEHKWPVSWSCLLLKPFRAFLRWARTWNSSVISTAQKFWSHLILFYITVHWDSSVCAKVHQETELTFRHWITFQVWG